MLFVMYQQHYNYYQDMVTKYENLNALMPSHI